MCLYMQLKKKKTCVVGGIFFGTRFRTWTGSED